MRIYSTPAVQQVSTTITQGTLASFVQINITNDNAAYRVLHRPQS